MTVATYRAWRVWQRNFDVFRSTWLVQISFTIIEPLVVLLAIGFGLGSYVSLAGSQSCIEFLAPGLLAAYAMFSSGAGGSWGTYIRMEHQRTFDAMIVTPLNIEDVVAGEILWAATRAVETTLALLLVMAVFQVPIAPSGLALLPVMFLQGVLFGAVGVLVVSRIPGIGELNHFFTLFLTPQYMLSGVFFPLSGLPAWASSIAWFMPLTHGVNLARSFISGEAGWGALGDLLWLLVVSAMFVALALHFMRRRLIK